jgi:hypothetical protein
MLIANKVDTFFIPSTLYKYKVIIPIVLTLYGSRAGESSSRLWVNTFHGEVIITQTICKMEL